MTAKYPLLERGVHGTGSVSANQLDKDGNWVDGKPYEHTVLDHLAEA